MCTFERQAGPGPAVLGTFESQVGPGPTVLGTFESQVGPAPAIKIKFFARHSFVLYLRSNYSSILIDFQCFRKACEPLKVLRLPAKTQVRHFVLKLALDRRFWATFERQVGPGPAVLGTFECQVRPGHAEPGTFERQVAPGLAEAGLGRFWGTGREGSNDEKNLSSSLSI